MTLDRFIEANMEPIMLQWVEFARTLVPEGSSMDDSALRDDGEQILAKIVSDMRRPQSGAQQKAKSQEAESDGRSRKDAAGKHATQRAQNGFEVVQLVSEFRALRATVLRLWAQSKRSARKDDLLQVTRYNEAVDAALTHSLEVFAQTLDQARHLFIGVLGHDMRGPLSTVVSCAQYGLRVRPESARESQMILRSAAQMGAMLDDLVEYTGQQLGVVTVLHPAPLLLDVFVREVVEEMAAIYPDPSVDVQVTGDLEGEWDNGRLHRVLVNLLTNAQKYGARGQPISIKLNGLDADCVSLVVHNTGSPIDEDLLPHIFEPLATGKAQRADASHPAGANLGLGLYVAREIVMAHGGSITVTSSAKAGTRFEVRLPRRTGRI